MPKSGDLGISTRLWYQSIESHRSHTEHRRKAVDPDGNSEEFNILMRMLVDDSPGQWLLANHQWTEARTWLHLTCQHLYGGIPREDEMSERECLRHRELPASKFVLWERTHVGQQSKGKVLARWRIEMIGEATARLVLFFTVVKNISGTY